MNKRSKKYYENRNNDNGDKKGSVNKAGYNEENEVTIKQEENPAPSKKEDKPHSNSDRSAQEAG